jgi:hypothetical protein
LTASRLALPVPSTQSLATAAGRIHPLWNDPRSGRLEIFTASLR